MVMLPKQEQHRQVRRNVAHYCYTEIFIRLRLSGQRNRNKPQLSAGVVDPQQHGAAARLACRSNRLGNIRRLTHRLLRCLNNQLSNLEILCCSWTVRGNIGDYQTLGFRPITMLFA